MPKEGVWQCPSAYLGSAASKKAVAKQNLNIVFQVSSFVVKEKLLFVFFDYQNRY